MTHCFVFPCSKTDKLAGQMEMGEGLRVFSIFHYQAFIESGRCNEGFSFYSGSNTSMIQRSACTRRGRAGF